MLLFPLLGVSNSLYLESVGILVLILLEPLSQGKQRHHQLLLFSCVGVESGQQSEKSKAHQGALPANPHGLEHGGVLELLEDKRLGICS